MVRALLAAALLAVATPAHALCDRLILSGISYHGDRSGGYNERNWGGGCQQVWSEDLTSEEAAYYNSLRYYSEIATATYTPWRLLGAKLGGSAGVVKYRDWMPFASISARWRVPESRWMVNAFVIPLGAGLTGAFLTLDF